MYDLMLPVQPGPCSNCGNTDWIAAHFGDHVGMLLRCESCKQVYVPKVTVVLTATIEPADA